MRKKFFRTTIIFLSLILAISGCKKINQIITFLPIVDQVFGVGPLTLTATSNSGLPVSLSVVSGPASLSGKTLTLTGAGVVTIRASQAGDKKRKAAKNVDRTFTVAKTSQSITFATISDQTFATSSMTLSATATSGLAVNFSIVSGPATVSENTLTLIGAGVIVVRASQSGDTNWGAADNVENTFTVEKANQNISFPTIAKQFFSMTPIILSATATSGLPVSFSVVSGSATISGTSLNIMGVGSIIVRASQAGDFAWNNATDIDNTFVVVKANQSINFSLANQSFGVGPNVLIATATSGLTVNLIVVSGPATISGNILNIIGCGEIIVRATQVGDSNWEAALKVDQALNIAKADQSISFPGISDQVFSATPLTLTATATSGLTVSFSVVSGPATISGTALTMTGPGTITLRASQLGDSNWNAATNVDRAFTVTKSNQIITFTLADQVFGVAPILLSSTTTSGLTVSFNLISGPATLVGSSLTITGPGSVTIRASQSGDSNWNAAVNVDRTITVTKGNQTISFALADQIFGVAPITLSSTATSGLAVSFSLISGPATLLGNVLTITGPGLVTIRAFQAGDSNWNAATNFDRTITVAKKSQTISFSISNHTSGDAPFTISATASSGLVVTFSYISGPATLTLGNTLTLTGTGTVTIRANQAGDATWSAASNTDCAFTVWLDAVWADFEPPTYTSGVFPTGAVIVNNANDIKFPAATYTIIDKSTGILPWLLGGYSSNVTASGDTWLNEPVVIVDPSDITNHVAVFGGGCTAPIAANGAGTAVLMNLDITKDVTLSLKAYWPSTANDAHNTILMYFMNTIVTFGDYSFFTAGGTNTLGVTYQISDDTWNYGAAGSSQIVLVNIWSTIIVTIHPTVGNAGTAKFTVDGVVIGNNIPIDLTQFVATGKARLNFYVDGDCTSLNAAIYLDNIKVTQAP